MNRSIAKFIAFPILLFSFNGVAQEDPYDGPGDTPSQPDIWVTPMEGGSTLYTPGDNQPIDESREGNRQLLNYDTEPASNSEPVITPDTDAAGSEE